MSISLALPSFPMTIHGNLKIGSSDMWTGAILTFSDGSGSTLGTYTTPRAGTYWYDSAISGMSPTFSEYSWSLHVSVQYLGQLYTVNSLSGSSQGCPSATAIVFVSDVCRYDIIVTAPVVIPSGWGGWWGGGWSSSSSSSSSSSASTTPIVSTTQTTQPITQGTPTSPVSNTVTLQNVVTITPVEFRKSKTITTQTDLKKGTIVTIFRILPNGREIKMGKARILPNGKLRYTIKTSGKYRFGTK